MKAHTGKGIGKTRVRVSMSTLACSYLLSVTVFSVTLGATEAGGGLGVVLTGAPCPVVLVTGICVAVTLTPDMKKRANR